MKLKYRYEKPDEIPAEHRGFYTEHEGAWVLEADGVAPAARLEAAEQRLNSLAAERDSLQASVDTLRINQAVLDAARRHGLRDEATADVTARATGVFRLVQGVPHASVDGQPESGVSVDDWVKGLLTEAPHLFNASKGAGGPAEVSPQAATANPWKRETFNLTKQGQLLKADPAKARALMRAAGLMVNG